MFPLTQPTLFYHPRPYRFYWQIGLYRAERTIYKTVIPLNGHCKSAGGAAVAEWLSSWLEEEERGSIPGLATWIFRDWLSPAYKSRYGWKIAKSTLILKPTNQPKANLLAIKQFWWGLMEREKLNISTIFYHEITYEIKKYYRPTDPIFSAPEPKAQVHYCDHALSVVRPSVVRSSSLTFHIFDFSSETTKRNSMKLDRKQDLNVLYQVCVFPADRKNKMAALASDWLRHFRLLLWNRWTEFNESRQEARS